MAAGHRGGFAGQRRGTGAVLAGLVVRRPGAAFLAAFSAALVSALLGSSWGTTALVYGIQTDTADLARNVSPADERVFAQLYAMADKKISVTPLSVDMTDAKGLADLEAHLGGTGKKPSTS